MRFLISRLGIFVATFGIVMSYKQTVADGYQVGGMTIVWSIVSTLGFVLWLLSKEDRNHG